MSFQKLLSLQAIPTYKIYCFLYFALFHDLSFSNYSFLSFSSSWSIYFLYIFVLQFTFISYLLLIQEPYMLYPIFTAYIYSIHNY